MDPYNVLKEPLSKRAVLKVDGLSQSRCRSNPGDHKNWAVIDDSGHSGYFERAFEYGPYNCRNLWVQWWLLEIIFVDQFTWTLPIKVVQSFANACISTHLSHIIDSINNSFLISWIFEVQYLRLSQIAPWLTRKLHKSDLSGTFIDSNKGPSAENCQKDKAYLESFLGLFQALQQW